MQLISFEDSTQEYVQSIETWKAQGGPTWRNQCSLSMWSYIEVAPLHQFLMQTVAFATSPFVFLRELR